MASRARLEQELISCHERGDLQGAAAALDCLAALSEGEGDPEPARILREEARELRRTAGSSDPAPTPPVDAEALDTARLLALSRKGDARARSRLAGRYLSVLRRAAHGRLPAKARDLMDTDDLVQVTLQRALSHLDSFEVRREGAFLAYLRRILDHQIVDEIRRTARHSNDPILDEELPDVEASPLDSVIERETLDIYEQCLQELPGEQRAAVMLRLEVGMSYEELARMLGKRTPGAARMVVRRGVDALRKRMESRRP